MAGVHAEADMIASSVQIKDSTTGALEGEFKIETLARGAYASGRGIIDQHAREIVQILATGKSVPPPPTKFDQAP